MQYDPTILECGQGTVINEPRGEHGLEGFLLNEPIKFQLLEYGMKKYYRVWKPEWEKRKYYEVCDKPIFKRFFVKL